MEKLLAFLVVALGAAVYYFRRKLLKATETKLDQRILELKKGLETSRKETKNAGKKYRDLRSRYRSASKPKRDS